MSGESRLRENCTSGSEGRAEVAADTDRRLPRPDTSGDLHRWEGLNAKPRRRTLVLVGWTLKAANPVRGLGGRAGG